MELLSDDSNTVFRLLVAALFLVIFQALLARNRRTRGKKQNPIRRRSTTPTHVYAPKKVHFENQPEHITEAVVDNSTSSKKQGKVRISEEKYKPRNFDHKKLKKSSTTDDLYSRDRAVSVNPFYGHENPLKGGDEVRGPGTIDVANLKRFATEFSISQAIGSFGGTLATGGCSVLIPRDALNATHQIVLQCVYEKRIFQDQESAVITPTVSLEPSDLKFSKPVVITLPAYFQPKKKTDLSSISIQTKKNAEGFWEDVTEVKNSFSGMIAFHVDHFSLYRGLLKNVFGIKMIKSLFFAGFLKRYNLNVNPENHVLIICFCPNLPHARQQIMADMTGEHYERVIESETFRIRHQHHIEIEITTSHPGVKVMASPRTITSSQLWYENFVKKEIFEISRQIDDVQGQIKLSFSLNVRSDSQHRRTDEHKSSGYFYWSDASFQAQYQIGGDLILEGGEIGALTVHY